MVWEGLLEIYWHLMSRRGLSVITEANVTEVIRNLARQQMITNPEQWGLVGIPLLVLCTPVKMGRATYANVYLYSCLCFPATPCTFGLASKILIKEYSEYVVKMNVSNS